VTVTIPKAPFIMAEPFVKTVPTCHTALMEAVHPYGLNELDVHDVFNIFMCSGFTRDTHEYFVKASPARAGDHIDIIADVDVLVALAACPQVSRAHRIMPRYYSSQGDVSISTGEDFPLEKCHPLKVEVFDLPSDLVLQWNQMNDRLAN